MQFALALQLSGLTDPIRVISFLLLPLHKAFDPSLAFLAAGALPLAIGLYRYGRGNEVPALGGKWGIPKGGPIDLKLLAGAAIFGVGWGMAGICREYPRHCLCSFKALIPTSWTWIDQSRSGPHCGCQCLSDCHLACCTRWRRIAGITSLFMEVGSDYLNPVLVYSYSWHVEADPAI